MIRSLRFQSLAFVVGILVVTTATIAVITLREVNNTVNSLELEAGRNVMNLVLMTLENDYRSLTFHRSYALQERKRQISDNVGIVISAIDEHRKLTQKGLISGQNARRSVLEAVQGLRYGVNDYFFIYDDDINAISHPDPAFRGRNLAQFTDAYGNHPASDLMKQALQGGGFSTFWWKRLNSPTPVPKLGFARYYEPWHWMIGTGVYIDDIEEEYRKRLQSIITDLSATLSKIRIANGGYIFIIDSNRKVVIHPDADKLNFSTIKNLTTGKLLADDLITASSNGKFIKYLWDRPDSPGQFRFEKIAFVKRFAPLDWYVVASAYQSDLKRPARNLIFKQILIILILSGLSIAGAIPIINRFITPIERLANYARELPARDFSSRDEEHPDLLKLSRRSDELGRLATSFRYMEHSLHNYLERLTETTAAKERIESELSIAHDIQMGLLRHTFPPYKERTEFNLSALIKPAREVGGDFYDFFLLDDSRLFFTIADVAGKGVPAALYMAMAMSLMKAVAVTGATPDAILARLNDELSRDNESCMFVTVFCGVLDICTGELVYANGGHNPPLLISWKGETAFLKSPGVLAPGSMEGTRYQLYQKALYPGDCLLLYTDGVTEAANLNDELFSDERLLNVITGMQPITNISELTKELLQHIESYAGSMPQSDDITIMAIEFNGRGTHKEIT